MAIKSIRSLSGQTWVDLALQQLGDESRLFELCDLNGVGITDELIPGREVLYPDFDFDKKDSVNTLKRIKPASDQSLVEDDHGEGIEFWGIEFDFLVS